MRFVAFRLQVWLIAGESRLSCSFCRFVQIPADLPNCRFAELQIGFCRWGFDQNREGIR